MILEVNLFAFTYRLFHEDFSSIVGVLHDAQPFFIHTYIHTNIHTYIHTYIPTHACIHTNDNRNKWIYTKYIFKNDFVTMLSCICTYKRSKKITSHVKRSSPHNAECGMLSTAVVLLMPQEGQMKPMLKTLVHSRNLYTCICILLILTIPSPFD